MKAPQPLYRPILKKALDTAWFHRELWPVAAIAGIAGTGTVLNDLLSQGKNAFAFPEYSATEFFGFMHFLKLYFSYLVHADATNAVGSFLIFLGVVILGAVCVIGAQHVILRTIHRAANEKEHLSGKELIKEMRHPRFGRLLALNFFFKLMIANLLIAAGLLLRDLETSSVFWDAFFGLIFAMIAVSLTFSLNVMAVFSLITVTKSDATLYEAVATAYKTLRSHPLVCLEMSTLLFGMNFLFTVAYISIIIFSAWPLLLLFTAALSAGSMALISFGTVLTVLLFLTFSIAFAGFVTTFTYSAWTELSYKILRAKKVHPRLHLHGKRLMEHFARAH